MMMRSTRNISLLLVILFFVCDKNLSLANDIINTTQSISGSQTLVSLGGNFELGFFSPGSSQNWYLGIWFKNITANSLIWVANREIPLRNSTSGILKVIEPGVLVLLNDTNNIIWSSNSNTSKIAYNPVVQLLDTGNLVLRDASDDHPENYLWQSFGYPADTLIAGNKFGWNYVTGLESYLTSWKNTEDPAPGEFTLHVDPAGYPQIITKKGDVTVYRLGPFNGVRLSGAPDMGTDGTVVAVLHLNKNGVYYSVEADNRSAVPKTKFTLSPSGVGQRWTWVEKTQEWVIYTSVPVDSCDTYKLCGAYGICQIGNYQLCQCLNKFVPKNPEGWTQSDWSSGCVRRTALNCQVGDGFLKYSSIKLPDARNSWYNKSMTLDECKVECLRNCSCMAYTYLNISEGGSGCLIWFGDLVDIRFLTQGGQDLYIRMSSSELYSNGKRKEIIVVSLAIGIALLSLCLLLYFGKRKKINEKRKRGIQGEINNKDLELPSFDFSVISKATNDFSIKNKLGEGGYGPVFKGTLEDGQDIAVKRLSKTSMQGLDEFKNEVTCIARHQHRNLVKLLGCCIQGDEKMLIYEYMPNRSLDLILFDEENRMSLDWPKRLHIVNGIARGLMYLHQDSRLRIIHRDLKASNILLDKELNPKISDFGLAKRFRGNETEDKTNRVMGTYGYMSPEYAVHGRFSVKSDVFSFGVLVIEIISGLKNSAFSEGDGQLNLLGYAWTLYREGRTIKLVDPCLQNTDNLGEVRRLIHVGLLCVQQCPDDRPSMTSVVSMLNNEAVLPQANHPGFFTDGKKLTPGSTAGTDNEITITILEGR